MPGFWGFAGESCASTVQIPSFPFDKRTKIEDAVSAGVVVGIEFGVRRGIGGCGLAGDCRCVCRDPEVSRVGVTGRPPGSVSESRWGGVFSWETPPLFFCPEVWPRGCARPAWMDVRACGGAAVSPDLRLERRSLVPRGAIPGPRRGGCGRGIKKIGRVGRGAGQCSWPQPQSSSCSCWGRRSECSPTGRAISSSMTE